MRWELELPRLHMVKYPEGRKYGLFQCLATLPGKAHLIAFFDMDVGDSTPGVSTEDLTTLVEDRLKEGLVLSLVSAIAEKTFSQCSLVKNRFALIPLLSYFEGSYLLKTPEGQYLTRSEFTDERLDQVVKDLKNLKQYRLTWGADMQFPHTAGRINTVSLSNLPVIWG